MELEEPPVVKVCKTCNTAMDDWHWIRFAGIGQWKDRNDYQSCPNCHKRFDGSDVPKVKEVPMPKMSVDRMMKAHDRDICSRVIGDDGNTVLKGNAGLKYMESKAKEVPGYVNRLKEYHNL